MKYLSFKMVLLMTAMLVTASGPSCKQQKNADLENGNPEISASSDETMRSKPKTSLEGLDRAVFASGCFWCVEAIFEEVKGVKEAISGYAGGDEANPSYGEVSSGTTGHAESVEVYYDPHEVDYKTLLKVFFGSHDPTTLNRQGPDAGTQYRSAIFYIDEEQKQQAEAYIQMLKDQKVFDGSITTEVSKLKRFYPAEDYHQDYEANHPDDPYILNVSEKRIHAFEGKFPELLKDK